MRYRELIVCRELGSESQHRAPCPNPGGQGEAKRGSVPGHAPNKSESRLTLSILRPFVMPRKTPVMGAVDHMYDNPIGQCTKTPYICSAQITPPPRTFLDVF